MSTGLETILQQTTETKPRPGHVLVTVDAADGRVVHGGGFLARMVASVRRTITYDLKIDTWAAIWDVERVLRVFVTKEDAKVHMRLRVIARASRAEGIVEALTDPIRGPTEVLLDVIGETIGALSDETQRAGPDNLLLRIARDRSNWQRRIEQSILDRIGLEAELIFELSIDGLDRPEISLRHLELRTRDAPRRIVDVSFDVTLEPTQERAHDPLPNSDREREERLRGVVAAAFRDEVLLYDVWFDRQRAETIVREAVDRALKTTAYRSQLVQMEPVEPPILLKEKVSCEIEWRGNSGRRIDFHVEAVLALLPTGAGLFDSLHLPPRRDWLAEQAQRALEIAMHGRDFWDLARVDQAEVAQKVESLLRSAAAETGQQVDPILAEVVLPENRWLDKQLVEVTGQSFKTRNELGVAEFDIAVELRFKTIRPLVDFVRRHRDRPRDADDFNAEIEQSIRDLVRKTAAAVMSQTEHADYFARWEQWEFTDDITPGAVRGEAGFVHDRLVLAIQSELRARFDPSLCVVRLRKVDRVVGEVIRYVNALGPITVNLDVVPNGISSRAQLIPVRIRWRPGQLEPSRVPDVVARGFPHLDRSAIADTLAGGSRQFLNDLEAAEIRSLDKGLATGRDSDGSDRRAVVTRLEEYVSRLMIDLYGFSVKVEDGHVEFTREQTAGLDTADLSTVNRQALADYHKARIVSGVGRDAIARRQTLNLIDRLNRDLQDNPRRTEEDRNRWDLDAAELTRLETRLAEDERRRASAVEETAGAVRLAAPVAAPPTPAAAPTVDGEPPAAPAEETAPADDREPEPPSPEPARPDRL